MPSPERRDNLCQGDNPQLLTLFLKGLLTATRVLPATLRRNRYNATKLDLRGMPNLVKATLGGYWRSPGPFW
jgi:hypothetical protein